jgi:predicted nucleic acid-binding protein
LEYEEIFLLKWGDVVTRNLLGRIMRSKNIEPVSIFFKFNVVNHDQDDNKFADAYLASNADFIVSNDSKLLKLNKLDFPVFKVITLQDFSTLLYEQSV